VTSTRENVARLERRLAALEALPEADSRVLAFEAVQGVIELYGAGLARIVELAPDLIPRLAEDELVAHLLMLHDLHPVDARERVERALEAVRPYLATHGGDVELVSLSNDVVRVRLQGTCKGCASSTVTLKSAIEAAIFKAAPEVVRVDAEGEDTAPAVISVESLVCPIP
jgi:Fe-S cluster biogenesis protein NfuA